MLCVHQHKRGIQLWHKPLALLPVHCLPQFSLLLKILALDISRSHTHLFSILHYHGILLKQIPSIKNFRIL